MIMNARSIVWALLWSLSATAVDQDRGELVDAIRHVRLDEIKNLLAQGANPSACGPDLYSPLMVAAEMGQAGTVALLLGKGANINGTCTGDITALMTAARRGNLAMVQLLVEKGADVNAKDAGGQTALMIAAERGDTAIVRLLVQRGADARALIWGLLGHYYKPNVVRLLVEHGADVNAADNTGLTPLMASPEPAFTQILLDHGANINAVDRNGKNALAMAACNAAQARFLLAHGAKIVPGAPVLAAAFSCEFGPCLECAQMYLEAGADINAAAWDGTTPLMIIVGDSRIDIAKDYLARGADVRARDKSGRTALHMVGFPEYVDLLAARGADVHARDQHQRTPLLAASRRDVIAALVRHGADVNARDAEGRTALFYLHGPENVEFLLANRAAASIRDNHGRTVLMAAVEQKDLFGIKVLIKHGVDVNAASKEGETAFSIAKREGNFEIGEILRAAGAK